MSSAAGGAFVLAAGLVFCAQYAVRVEVRRGDEPHGAAGDLRRTAHLMPAYERVVDRLESEGWLPATLAGAARARLPE